MEISSTSVFLLQRAPESLIRVSGQVLLGGFHLDGKRVNRPYGPGFPTQVQFIRLFVEATNV
jgi:hypothetical protein